MSTTSPSFKQFQRRISLFVRTLASNVGFCSERKIKGWNFVVISVLWSTELIHPWVQEWEDVTIAQLALFESNAFFINHIVVTVFKIFVTLISAGVVDLKNRKFWTYFISLLVYVIGPLFWIVAAISKYAVIFHFPPWFISCLFVTTPVKYVLIFNQKRNASAVETRQIVAFLELTKSLSTLVVVISIPRSPISYPLLNTAIVWVVLLLFTAVFIVVTAFIKPRVTKDIIAEPTVLAVLEGIKRNIIKGTNDSQETANRKTANLKQFITFILLLLPIIAITSFDVALATMDSSISRNDQETANALYKFLAKLIAVPTIALIFSCAKGLVARLGDIIVIAIAHGFNIFIICLILIRIHNHDIVVDIRKYDRHSPSVTLVDQRAVTNPEGAVIHIYNGTNMLFFLKTPFYESISSVSNLELPVTIKDGDHSMSFSIEIRKNYNDKPLIHNITVQKFKHYWFILNGKGNEFTKLIQAHGADEISLTSEPTVIVMNGIVGEIINGTKIPVDHNEHYLVVSGKKSDSILLPESNTVILLSLPYGEYYFLYTRKSRTQDFKQVAVELKPYSLYALVIAVQDDEEKISLQTAHSFEELSTSTYSNDNISSTLTPKPPTSPTAAQSSFGDDRLLTSSCVLSGLTEAATMVGYIHYFWMESPRRLQTTLLACFLVVNEIVAEITKGVIEEFGKAEAVIFLVLSTFAGISHVVLGVLYDKRFRRELFKTREGMIKTASDSVSSIEERVT